MVLFGSEKLESMEDLLLHQVKDLYDAEIRIFDAIPEMAETVSSSRLKSALLHHQEETGVQIKRLENVFDLLGEKVARGTCKAAKGLIDEASDTLAKSGAPEVIDAAIIAAAQRIEHYEIAGYGSAKAFAEKCGYADIAAVLGQSLEEGKRCVTGVLSLVTK